MLEALLAVEMFYPDVDVDFLKTDSDLVKSLAAIYHHAKIDPTTAVSPVPDKYFLSEEKLAIKDKRAKMLFKWGLRGQKLKETYIDREKYSLEVIEKLITYSHNEKISSTEALANYSRINSAKSTASVSPAAFFSSTNAENDAGLLQSEERDVVTREGGWCC